MRLLVFILLVLFGAVSLALFAMENPGYVLIARQPWSVEMSLTVFLVLLAVGVVALYLLLHGLVRLWNTPRDVARWRRRRRTRAAHEALMQSLASLAEGSWAEAEKNALSDLYASGHPMINYLIAAYAAELQGNDEKRDQYLSQAQENAPERTLTTGMAQAQLLLLARQHEAALASLQPLRSQFPNHPRLLHLLAQIYQQLQDWDSLARLVPELRKHKVLPEKDIDGIELEAHRRLLLLPLPDGAGAVLRQAWNVVPPSLRRDPELVGIYARQLLAQKEHDECERLLSTTIENHWNDKLVHLYGLVASSSPSAQLDTAMEWLTRYGDNPVVLLTLGRICRRNQMPGRAREYLEKCIRLQGPVEAYHELGRLLIQADEPQRALELWDGALERYTKEIRALQRAPAATSPARPGRATTYYGY